MASLLRTPWPTFGIGLGLSATGLAIARAHPEWGRDAGDVVVCVLVFGGLALIALSLALQDSSGTRDGVRRLRYGALWLASWLLLRWAVMALGDLAFASLNTVLGPGGSPSRLVAAFVLFVGVLLLPLILASRGAEALRRAAAWLGESASSE